MLRSNAPGRTRSVSGHDYWKAAAERKMHPYTSGITGAERAKLTAGLLSGKTVGEVVRDLREAVSPQSERSS